MYQLVASDARVLSRLVTDFDTGRPMSASDAESGSEWETEDGGDEEEEGEEEEVDDDDDGKVVPQVEVATLPSSGISYSSILKKQASSEDSALKDSKRVSLQIDRVSHAVQQTLWLY